MATATNREHELSDDIEPVADETAHQAQRIVASYSADADECRMLLAWLGLGPAPRDPDDDA